MSAPEVMDDREAMQRARALRYSQAIVAASLAEQRIADLTEKLAEAEYLRRIAEDEAGAASWIDDDGSRPWASSVDTHVYHVGEPEPGDDREYLFSLSDGVIYKAVRYRTSVRDGETPTRHGWNRLQYESNTIADWDAALEHAPLLAFTRDTDFGLDELARTMAEHVETAKQLRRRLPHDPEKSLWAQPSLPDRLSLLEMNHLRAMAALRDQLAAEVLKRCEAEGHAARFATAVEANNPALGREALVAWNEAES